MALAHNNLIKLTCQIPFLLSVNMDCQTYTESRRNAKQDNSTVRHTKTPSPGYSNTNIDAAVKELN